MSVCVLCWLCVLLTAIFCNVAIAAESRSTKVDVFAASKSAGPAADSSISTAVASKLKAEAETHEAAAILNPAVDRRLKSKVDDEKTDEKQKHSNVKGSKGNQTTGEDSDKERDGKTSTTATRGRPSPDEDDQDHAAHEEKGEASAEGSDNEASKDHSSDSFRQWLAKQEQDVRKMDEKNKNGISRDFERQVEVDKVKGAEGASTEPTPANIETDIEAAESTAKETAHAQGEPKENEKSEAAKSDEATKKNVATLYQPTGSKVKHKHKPPKGARIPTPVIVSMCAIVVALPLFAIFSWIRKKRHQECVHCREMAFEAIEEEDEPQERRASRIVSSTSEMSSNVNVKEVHGSDDYLSLQQDTQ
eukprot:gnl/TRDRNA2_/TRDRNA2_129502_c0_seq2.p1 gnl/TRDRNA2_/TRDRNA2_129502_c0~~gnl/TRDRNA2_/TRDRNA2_129502_c0_seq2.p1  ORF type:complete len:362 (+),score=84.59 gnl/TRDRNA2_/TRDRNA2_129502_c0_seq2:41-1126(+)